MSVIAEPTTPALVGRRRRSSLTVHLAGLTLVFLAPGMVLSAAVEAGAGGTAVAPLLVSALVLVLVGVPAWRLTTIPERLTGTNALATVAVTWITAALAGALPYLFAGTFSFVDEALFEAVSGFTGTGSTVLDPIEGNPRGILFWRSMTQWYGGMGMVVLAVSVLPFLGVGGMDLMSAESPGPSSDRLAPRVSETAKRLWLLYGGFTLLAVVSLLAVGLSFYDAVVHAFAVVSTGGFSPYNDSIGHFDSVAVEMVVSALMLIGGTSFALHWQAVTGHPGTYLRSAMFRVYGTVFVVGVAAITILLLGDGFAIGQAVRDGVFNVATLVTSTGFGTSDFTTWVPAAQIILLAIMVGGGMAGSTAGGMKLVRLRLAFGTAVRELRRVRHPHAVLPVRIGSVPTPESIVSRVAGFVALFLLIVIGGTVVLSLLGSDLVTASSGAVSMMSNMGPGLGEAGPASNFLVFTRPARLVLMGLMFAGRLEIIPIMVLLGYLARPLTRARYAGARWTRR
jgi:trk system potassium uptake protein TrkH